jgi:hypothetical protein
MRSPTIFYINQLLDEFLFSYDSVISVVKTLTKLRREHSTNSRGLRVELGNLMANIKGWLRTDSRVLLTRGLGSPQS